MENRRNKNLKEMTDDELAELLFTEGDRLPREHVDEFLQRGEKIIELLADIVEFVSNWEAEGDRSWSPIHATPIIGAIGGEYAIDPLLMSLRFSDAFEVDWLWENIPAMFGKIGAKAVESLKKFALDKSNTSFCRGVALDSLAAIASENKNVEREILDFIAQFLKDSYEDMGLRGSAGSILLDFGETRYKKSLLEFVADEEEMKETDPFYVGTFDEEWIEENLEERKRNLESYTRDWLDFYDEEEIEKRQKRWKRENSWWGKVESFWINKRIQRNYKDFYEGKIREAADKKTNAHSTKTNTE
jgi:hypothetical protein